MLRAIIGRSGRRVVAFLAITVLVSTCEQIVKNELKTLAWYLKRPALYPHLARTLFGKLTPWRSARDNTQQEATQWCIERSIDTNTALGNLTGKSELDSVRRLFPDIFDAAEKRASDCPVEMGGPGNLDLLYWCAEHLKATKIIETGVAYGWSSLAVLLSLNHRQNSQLISTDKPYANRNNEPFVGCVVPQEFRQDWCILRLPDRQALPKALMAADSFDLCHYDSDKSYSGRKWAYAKLWKALRPGGFFISDDIDDNTAFRDFSAAIECDPVVVRFENKFIGIIIKPGG